MTATKPGWVATLPTRPRAWASACGLVAAVGRDALGEHAAQRDDPGLGSARRQQARAPGAEGQQRHAAGAAHGQAAEHERHALGDVGLQPLRGAERHRRRDVEHDPRRQRALGDLQAHVGLAGARGRRRVDLAHVVADLVRAQLRELGARAHARRAAIAGQRAGRVARDDEVERVDAAPSACGRGPGGPQAV